MGNKQSLIFLGIVLVFAVLVRAYNFSNRITFGPEQAISLISAAENIQKPSLLGMPYLLRATDGGLRIFHSPLFVYSLIPQILLFEHNIYFITAISLLLNVATGVVLYFVIKKIYGITIAFFSTILFLFSDYMIYHSLFIWISNYMPLVGMLTFYLLYKFKQEKNKATLAFLLGIASGIGFGIQYFYILGILIVFAFILKYSRRKFYDVPLFAGGLIIGELPTVLFDIKHSFYHVKTLFSYFTQILTSPGQSQLSYYHFLFLWPIGAVILGYILFGLYKKNKASAIILTLFYVALNLLSPRISFKHAIGMPEGLSVRDILLAASAINKDNPGNFNVTVLMNFDHRGYVLRYPLRFLYDKEPLSVEEYPNADSIYALAEKDYNFTESDLWEIRSGGSSKISRLTDVGQGYSVYKLEK